MSDLMIREPVKDLGVIMNDYMARFVELTTAIRSFDDIERLFFKGAGLSANTYRSYLTSAKAFYDFTGGLHPLQVTPGHIEEWFDDMLKRVDRNTATLRITGLKRFFVGVERTVPEASPFRKMDAKLIKKMGKRKKKDLDALSVSELQALLTWLSGENTPRAKMEYATVLFLATSGLRAAEALSLTYGDIYEVDGFHYCRFVQKGGDLAKQELFPAAINAMRDAFKAIHGRVPLEGDGLFWTMYRKPMPYHTLWKRMTDIGARAVAEGIIRGDILFTPHLMRRTFATVLHGAGMSIKAVQGNTRHKNSSTLTEHYLKNKENTTPYFADMLATKGD